MKSVLHIFLEALLRLQSVVSMPICLLSAFERSNSAEQKQSYIYGQGALKGQKLYCARANLTACETVSVYNAMIYSGCDRSLERIKKRFLSRGALTLFFVGFFGGNPYSMGRVLRSFGMKYKAVTLENMTEDGGYIVSFWNGRKRPTLHTVFVVKDGGRFTVYNMYSNDTRPRAFEPEKYKGLYIRGYYLGER